MHRLFSFKFTYLAVVMGPGPARGPYFLEGPEPDFWRRAQALADPEPDFWGRARKFELFDCCT